MTNNKTAEWREKCDQIIQTASKYGLGLGFLGDFITGVEQSAYQRGREEVAAKILEKIGFIKEKVEEVHGTSKYNSCYEDCELIVKQFIKPIEKTLATDKPGQEL